jgi:ABC-type polysaccharide/polyol phosphate export permease
MNNFYTQYVSNLNIQLYYVTAFILWMYATHTHKNVWIEFKKNETRFSNKNVKSGMLIFYRSLLHYVVVFCVLLLKKQQSDDTELKLNFRFFFNII